MARTKDAVLAPGQKELMEGVEDYLDTELRAIEKAYYASYGYPPEYALDLLDFNRDLNDTATRYINYLLIEE